ncbi:MAG: hypothetical protein G01um101466_87 [Parcubacteria group bacterium Gr01-1014_66]|nr:MAG: hypothetical protein G01um101466_87 [Parcubacteria group bacterium Gr01-1014_66]
MNEYLLNRIHLLNQDDEETSDEDETDETDDDTEDDDLGDEKESS